MRILITGGAGFLGLRLARTLLGLGSLSLNGQAAQPITRIVLADRVAPPEDLLADSRTHAVTGDLNVLLATGFLASHADTALVFHLAAAVSAECEADFDLACAAISAPRTRCWRPAARCAASPLLFSPVRWLCLGKRPCYPCPKW
jgi:D-erythronate 2-dehydrogenase